MKTCRRCLNEFDESNFAKNKGNVDGLQSYCKSCNVEKNWEWRIKKRYGITADDYWNMVEEQDNKCLICGGKDPHKKLAVDHCHKTGKVRGLLCYHCNIAIGHLRDDPERIRKAIQYLEEKQ